MKITLAKLAMSGVVAGALALVGFGLAQAQAPPGPWPGRPGAHGPAMMAGMHANGAMMAHHPEHQAAMAAALGMTVEELQAQLAAGKTVAAIAQERGVDLTAVHAAMQAEYHAAGMAGMWRWRGMHMGGPAGMGTDCPYLQQ
jgi:hypothetical protein